MDNPQYTPDTPLKKCPKCGNEYPATLEFFPPRKRNKNGLLYQCRGCTRAEAKLFRQRHSKEVRENDRLRRIKRRTENLEREREKDRIRGKRYYATHRDQHRAKARRNERIRRARKANSEGAFTAEDVQLQLKSQRGKDGVYRCWWCGEPLDPEHFEVDHRIPLKHGGSNGPRNIVCTHVRCNRRKSDKMPWQFNGRLL